METRTRGDRITFVRKHVLGFKSQQQLADKLGVTRGAVGNWERGGEIGFDNLTQIQRLSGVSPQWIEMGEGDLPQSKAKEPVAKSDNESQDVSGKIILEYDLRAGASYGGGYALTGDNHHGMTSELVKDEWAFPESWLRGEMRLSYRSTDILAIDGPSMIPDLSPGDRVLIDRSNRDPKNGAIFAVREGDSVVVKHVQLLRNTDPPRIVCRSSNPQYEPFELVLDGEHVAIIGRVAGKICKM